jgi:hypothetical protein
VVIFVCVKCVRTLHDRLGLVVAHELVARREYNTSLNALFSIYIL